MIEFDWDIGNLSKLDLVAKSGRKYYPDEVESVFYDEYKIIGTATEDPISGEKRFYVIGQSNLNNILVVIFVARNGKVRIFNAWKAKGAKLKQYNNEKNEKLEG